jgi:hypothetical protein
MTVSSATRKAGPFLGNGVATAFPFTFKVFAASNLQLTLTDSAGVETVLTLNTHYSVSLNADQDNNPGGTITYPLSGAPMAAGYTLVGLDVLPVSQGTDITNAGRFLPQIHEDVFDKLTIFVQQLKEKVGRALLVAKTESISPNELPAAASRAGKFLAFDASGQPTMSSGTGADSGLRADLAATGGGALVATISTLAGAIARTLAAKVADTLSIKDFANVTGDGAADDTAGMNTAISNVSTAAGLLGRRLRIVWPDGVYMTDGLLVKPNVHFDFGNAVFRKRSNGVSINTNSLMRAVQTLTGTTYYGTYKNIKITGGRFESNGFTCPAHIVQLQYCDDLEMENVTVVHSVGIASWGFCLGGRRLKLRGLKVLGGSELFQDGVHITHGQDMTISDIYSASGDDALALGGEPTDVYQAADPDSIRRVNISNVTTQANRGAAVKVYVQASALGVNWEISDINIKGVAGTAGVLRNGGITIIDNNNTAKGTSQIRRVEITGVKLQIGSAAHDGTNPFGLLMQSTYDVKVEGSMTFVDGAAPGFRLAKVIDSDIHRIEVNCPALPRNGGVEFLRTRRSKVRDSVLIGSAAQALPSLVMTDAESLELESVQMTAVPSGVNVAAITAGTLTHLTASRSKFGHVGGAAAGIGLDTTSANFAFIGLDRCDFTEAFQAAAGASIIAGAAWEISRCRGLSTVVKGIAVIPNGSTSVVVIHGAGLPSAALTQVLLTARGWGLAKTVRVTNFLSDRFTVEVDVDPGAGTASFNWVIDTGSKP